VTHDNPQSQRRRFGGFSPTRRSLVQIQPPQPPQASQRPGVLRPALSQPRVSPIPLRNAMPPIPVRAGDIRTFPRTTIPSRMYLDGFRCASSPCAPIAIKLRIPRSSSSLGWRIRTSSLEIFAKDEPSWRPNSAIANSMASGWRSFCLSHRVVLIAPPPFEIESPLPQDVSGFQRNRHAVVVRYQSRRIVRRRAGCGHPRAIHAAV
jgi:hypothetical protein